MAFGLITTSQRAACDQPLQLVEVRRIWDQAPHNAFTDLVRYRERWYCAFREGKGHVSPDGALRIITSVDTVQWQTAAYFTSQNSDLRDAKLSVTPGGWLMLSGAEAMHDRSQKSHQSIVWYSPDGVNWSERYDIGDPNFWLWRVTWLGNRAYGLGYGCSPNEKFVRLYSSDDGIHFNTLVDRLMDENFPNESSIVFDGETAYCLLRRDGPPRPKKIKDIRKLKHLLPPDRDSNDGLFGVAKPPYTQWNWQSLGRSIGGPHMILLPDGRLLAAVRLSSLPVRTSLCWIDKQTGRMTEALELPSGGDTSYAGLVFYAGYLWVSYYSSHEGKANIYLAKVTAGAPE